MNVDLFPLESVLDLYRSDFQLTLEATLFFFTFHLPNIFFSAARHDFITVFEEI